MSSIIWIETLFKLCVAHAVTDCLMQDPKLFSIGYFKNPFRTEARLTFGEKGHEIYWLLAHGLLNGAGVWLVTGSEILGIIETILHSLIDLGKMKGLYNVHIDQAAHFACKAAYIFVLAR